MTFDLGSHDFDLGGVPPAPGKPVDASGKPHPTTAYLITADGLRIQADITYDGLDLDTGDRRYALKVESDWLSLRLAACEVDCHPHDVRVMFLMPGDFDPEHRRQLAEVLRNIQWVVGSAHRPDRTIVTQWRKTDG